MDSKKFRSTVKPFLSSKGFIYNNDTTLEIDNKIIEDGSELTKTFNSHYINIVKSTTGKHPTKLGTFPAGIYLLKVNNRNTRTRCEICSKLTIKTPERRQWRRSGVFIVNFEHISHLVLVFLLLTLSR